jgi:8-oxo-dGTP pyrophosphatase MutT (NUDIX family)
MSRFVLCPGGAEHWGPAGAAGLALWSDGGSGALLLQKRAMFTHQGGTWSVPGGALELDEDVREAALRETGEELAIDLDGLEVLGEIVDLCPHIGCGWTYTTVVAALPGRPRAVPGNWESESLRWTERVELQAATDGTGGPALHAGLLRSLPRIVALVRAREPETS